MSKRAIKRILTAVITEAAEELDTTYTKLLEELISDAGGTTSSASENGTARTTTTVKPSEGPSEMAKSVAQLILQSPSFARARAYKLSLMSLNEADRGWVILQLSNSPKISSLLLDELMDVH